MEIARTAAPITTELINPLAIRLYTVCALAASEETKYENLGRKG